MGLKLTINKQDNALYMDFTDAYWKVEDIMFSNFDGEAYVSFSLNAYPTRDASKMMLAPMEYTGTIPVGGASTIAYNPRLWHWEGAFRTADVFPSGIPISESEQKDVLYQLVKTHTRLPFEDVIEEAGNG